jgi:uncharacterized coiled-coil DUF342 family protein
MNASWNCECSRHLQIHSQAAKLAIQANQIPSQVNQIPKKANQIHKQAYQIPKYANQIPSQATNLSVKLIKSTSELIKSPVKLPISQSSYHSQANQVHILLNSPAKLPNTTMPGYILNAENINWKSDHP